MKTAKEWVASMDKCFDHCVTRPIIDHSPSEMEKLVERIQGDAQVHGEAIGRVKGLREAAEIAREVGSILMEARTDRLADRLEAKLIA